MPEGQRGCGYRKVGGLYLCSDGVWVSCDRLPMPVLSCPVCGGGIKFSRGMSAILPKPLFGDHNSIHCTCDFKCFCCYPKDELAYLMWVGEKFYTPQSFMLEAQSMGVSKRISALPKKFKLGETVVYLAHKKAIIPRVEVQVEGDEGEQVAAFNEGKPQPGIFSVFIPQRVEMPIWEHDATPEFLEALGKRGITPVIVNAAKHAPDKRDTKKLYESLKEKGGL